MDTPKPVFKCVPLDSRWIIAGTKLDLKAIYRRPRRVVGEYDEITLATTADGLPAYDLTGPLPMRRHADWEAKGFEYVTLADQKSLNEAAPFLREQGLSPAEYVQHPTGPWNPKLYMATAEDADRAAFAELRAMVDKFGIAAVEEIRKKPLPALFKEVYLKAQEAPAVAKAPKGKTAPAAEARA